jgi:CheY-like chemotaxis protein
MSSEPKRVLLADDNRDAADTMAAFLELLGFEVSVARDGLSAVEEALRRLPDVAILDLGYAGAGRLVGLPPHPANAGRLLGADRRAQRMGLRGGETEK